MNSSRLELRPEEVSFAVDVPCIVDEDRSSSADCADGKTEARSPWGAELIGQPRALEALRMGIRIRSKGYNVYVSGAPGTGRRTAVLRALTREPVGSSRLHDIAYVYDFEAPLAPRVLLFPAGKGREWKADLHRLVESLKEIVHLQDESEAQKKTESAMTAELEAEENRCLAEFEAELAAKGFRAVQLEGEGGVSMDIVPLVPKRKAEAEQEPSEPAEKGPETDEEAESLGLEESSFEALQDLVASGQLPEADYNALRERWYGYMDRMGRLFADLRRGRSELSHRIQKSREEALKPQVKAETSLLAERWPDPAIRAWISALEKDVLSHLYVFRPSPERQETEHARGRRHGPALARYGVNLVVDRSGAEQAPVVLENHPSVGNLFGFVESRPDDDGDTRSAYLKIRAGSYLEASGGFLVLRAEDVLGEEEAWLRLKRALQDGKAEIQPREGPFGAGTWLKPQAAPVDVKVVMIGGEGTYDVLYQADPDFQKLFKVHAEFDSTMSLNPEGLKDYAAFVRKIVEEEGLLPTASGGLAAVAEEGARLAEYRDRLSTRFGLIADILREADYRARSEQRSIIDGEAIRGAVAARARLANLPEEKIEDMIRSGEIILQVEGSALGRVNGLAVHDRGYYAFGLPAVISAQVSPGEGGVINIEGESGLSGEIYDKAVLIVEGFLRSRYARDFPLAVTASICFEQSYTAVEGDSASSTAVYALLSAIANIPLRQDIAVTGSMNQIGQVQPVGGVNEKIEGFFRVCKQAGFSGSQGVMIPRRNVSNLILPREIQDALRAGQFHLWAVSSIDEGIEVLTGMEAGKPNERGDFSIDSFNGKVRRELQRMAKTIKNYLG